MRAAPGQSPSRVYAEMIDEVRLADELGFHAFWTSEQHAVADGHLGAQLTALAAAATVSRRLRLMTSALLLPYYNPRQVAEQATVVDLLSRGRLSLCVAAGAYEREFAAFGVEKKRRGRLLEEKVAALRSAFDQGFIADGPGGSHLPFTPMPVQNHLPVLIGGISEAAVDRAARIGDGHVAYDYQHPEVELFRQWEEVISPALQRHRRSPDDFQVVIGMPIWVSDDPERAWVQVIGPAFRYQQRRYLEMTGDEAVPDAVTQDFDRTKLLVDTPEGFAERVRALRARIPFAELGFWYRLPGISHAQACEHLELLAERVLPRFRNGAD